MCVAFFRDRRGGGAELALSLWDIPGAFSLLEERGGGSLGKEPKVQLDFLPGRGAGRGPLLCRQGEGPERGSGGWLGLALPQSTKEHEGGGLYPRGALLASCPAAPVGLRGALPPSHLAGLGRVSVPSPELSHPCNLVGLFIPKVNHSQGYKRAPRISL